MRRLALTSLCLLAACAAQNAPVVRPLSSRGSVALIGPRCQGVSSCLLGRVVAAESSVPMARAAVFLELERTGESAGPVRFLALTDDQGVFTVADAPVGRYRLAIYKDARRIEARGLALGGEGITMLPIQMPAGS